MYKITLLLLYKFYIAYKAITAPYLRVKYNYSTYY